MNTKHEVIKGFYCGIEVQVLAHWDHYSVVWYEDREFIVETTDLTVLHSLAKAA